MNFYLLISVNRQLRWLTSNESCSAFMWILIWCKVFHRSPCGQIERMPETTTGFSSPVLCCMWCFLVTFNVFFLYIFILGESRKFDPNFKGPIQNRSVHSVVIFLFKEQKRNTMLLLLLFFPSGVAPTSSAVFSSFSPCLVTLLSVFSVRIFFCYCIY